MANVTRLTQPGYDGTTQDAMFLTLFGHEVLSSFEEATVMRDKHMVKQVSQGKAVSMPVVGRAAASYHTEGEDLLGGTYLSQIPHNQRIITLDSMLTSSAFVPEIQELKNHWSERQAYAQELGFALGQKYDKQVLKVLAQAARAEPSVSGELGNLSANTDKQSTSANMRTDGGAIMNGLFDAAQLLDEMHVPGAADGRRWAVVTPAMYYALLQVVPSASASTIAPTDSRIGGAASITQAAPAPIVVAGIKVVMSQNIDTNSSDAQESGTNTDYEEDTSDVAGYVFHETAVGTAQLRDLTVTSDYIPQNLGTLLVGKMCVGHNYLRANACVELNVAAFT